MVLSHTILSFARHLVLPCYEPNGSAGLLQRPILRLPSQGTAWVALFFVLLGYVNSLKAVGQARSGAVEEALQTIAGSTIRWTARLVLPAAAATFIAWLACQLGFFSLASRSDAYWLQVNSAQPSDSWGNALQHLVEQIFSTWLYAENHYDQPQWALFYLIEGSMYVLLALLATIRTTPRFRMFAEGFLYIWSWCTGDCKALLIPATIDDLH